MFRQIAKCRRRFFVGLFVSVSVWLVWIQFWVHDVTWFNAVTSKRAIQMSTIRASEQSKVKVTETDIYYQPAYCDLTEVDRKQYPTCFGKLSWMLDNWKIDPCYATHGVDGSLCSIIRYLHRVEGWCPGNESLHDGNHNYKPAKAVPNTDLDGLLWLLRDTNYRASFAWVRMRIKRMWPKWTAAINSLTGKQNLSNRLQKRILIHIGVMTNASGNKFVERQFTGGPLGEFVQWSDIISSLYLLGHKLIITSEQEQLPKSLDQPPMTASRYCTAWRRPHVDLVYTDIIGLGQVSQFVRDRCIFRIVDSFGTEPAFNRKDYAVKHNLTTVWGQLNFNTRQFGNMFPHTPDNTFLGFVVERYLDDVKARDITRRHQALVYGKNAYMWSGQNDYIRVFNESGLEVHGTVQLNPSEPRPEEVPDYVINHGVLKGDDLHVLLRQSKIFIGLGFPYEGPAALEAIANGCVFINPLYPTPRDRTNNNFFKGKPTGRKVYSQNDYAYQFIGDPFVYTININDLEQVRNAVKKILASFPMNASLPYEYTEEGMLQRMNAFTEHQEFCAPEQDSPTWPPGDAVHFHLGGQGRSCKDVCLAKELICEPTYFKTINTKTALETSNVTCEEFNTEADIFYPAINVEDNKCFLQKDSLLFSCAGSSPNLRRLCPCRTYIKGQTALCIGCET